MIDYIFQLSLDEQIVYGVLLFATVYQIFVWIGYSIIATHRHHGRHQKGSPLPSISVVVVIAEGQQSYVDEGLDVLLNQKYEGSWEVVVVNDCAGSELSNILELKKQHHPNLRYTEFKVDHKFHHSRKISLLVGFKAALKENLLITDPTVVLPSDKWLSIMARGFIDAQIVLGYTGFEQGTNMLIRASRFSDSLRWLRAAIIGRPYKGIFNNIGYQKEVFFASRGFTHLRLPQGEDDLFIQKIARRCDAGIILNAHATARQKAYGGLGWWWQTLRYQTQTYRFYPSGVKFRISCELFVRLLFFVSVVLTVWLPYRWAWTIGLATFVIRELVMIWSARRVMHRLGERKLMLGLMIYDIIAPFTQAALSISRRLKMQR